VSSEGDYAVQDADWNYKDVPHVHYVHALAEQTQFLLDREVMGVIQLQRILKMRIPVLNVAYEFEKFRQLSVSTLFFFVVVIDTRSEALGQIRTRVTTTYSIGCPRALFFLTPLLKWAFRRNFRILMNDDIPMRVRRGALRRLGYSFRMTGETYGFSETVNLLENRLQAPAGSGRTLTCSYTELLAKTNEGFVGDIGLLGYRLVREGSEVMVFPRACPHEGSSLDESACVANALTCRWHGRRIRPIGKFAWGQNGQFQQGPYRGQVVGDLLTIEYDDATASLANDDDGVVQPARLG
jgi:nitrite reductase/ring-hydroxylating ferredoxin subunit